MSTTVPSINYDDCIVLFSNFHTGSNRDFRSRLFMSELKHHAQKQRGAQIGYRPTDLNIDVNNMEAANSIYFKDNKKYGLGDNDLHVEWVFWLASVMRQRSGLSMANINANSTGAGDAILALIQKLANAQPGSFEELVALFISEKLLATLTNAGGITVMPTRSQWGTATDFSFKNLQANALIADRSAVGRNLNVRADLLNTLVGNAGNLIALLTFTAAPTAVPPAGQANGVQIAQYLAWSAITDPTTGALLNASTDARYNDSNAVTNMANFLGDWNAVNGNAATQVAADQLMTQIETKITNDIMNAKQFSYRQDAFMLKRLFQSTKKTKVSVSNWFDERPVSQSGTLSNERYYRKSLDGTLWERLPNGTEKCVDTSDDKVLASLKEDDKCFGLGVPKSISNNGNTLTCAEYFGDCITNGNVANCKKFLTEPTFWANAANEVANMLPEMAYRTLKSFEFETYDEFSKQANRSFKMVQTWSEWLNACEKNGKLKPDEKLAISQNVKLQEYLNGIIKKVNDNPSILNKDYYGDKPSDLSTVFKGTLLAKRGLTYEAVPKKSYTSAILRVRNALNDSRLRTEINLRQNIHPTVRFVLNGGGPQLVPLRADLIDHQYNTLKARLKVYNKDIEPEDEKKIKELIESLKNNELKLNEFIAFAERYADLIQVFGQTDKETSLTVDHLKEFTKARDNYFDKVSRKQNSLMSIIQAIAEKVNEISNKTNPTTKKTVPIN